MPSGWSLATINVRVYFGHGWMVRACLQALEDVVERPAGSVFLENMMSSDIVGMYSIFVDV